MEGPYSNKTGLKPVSGLRYNGSRIVVVCAKVNQITKFRNSAKSVKKIEEKN